MPYSRPSGSNYPHILKRVGKSPLYNQNIKYRKLYSITQVLFPRIRCLIPFYQLLELDQHAL